MTTTDNTTKAPGQTWEEFLAEDVDHKKLKDQRDEAEVFIKTHEQTIRDIEWKLITINEVSTLLQTKLFDMETETVSDECAYERLQGFIQELEDSRYALFDEAGAAARYRNDMKAQYDSINTKCGERWKVVRQLFDGA